MNNRKASREALDIEPEAVSAMSWEQLSKLSVEFLQDAPTQPLAQALQRLETNQSRTLLRKLSNERASEILSEMDAEEAAEILSKMREFRALEILEELDPDDAVDMVGELQVGQQEQLLNKLEPETSQTLKTLLNYDSDTVGGVMTTEVATVDSTLSVDQAIQRIRQQFSDIESLYYIYVVDAQETLLGVLSMRDLILAQSDTCIDQIMTPEIRGVQSPDADRETVARELGQYNLMALPVVDSSNRIIGLVTHDDVLDIVEEEATEDLQKLLGAGGDEGVFDSVWEAFKKRSPWLLLNLTTAFMAAGIVSLFRGQIEQLTLIAVFMSIVPSIGGNTGAQSLAVTIRGIALGAVQPRDQWEILFKETLKALSCASVVGVLASLLAWQITAMPLVGLVVMSAMLLNMILAGVMGAFIPMTLKKFGLDPAQSSTIFLTATTDIAGFFIFLSLSAWILL